MTATSATTGPLRRGFGVARLLTGPKVVLIACWCGVGIAFVLLAAHRWSQLGPEATGIDQGHWLAFGNAYWGHGNSSLSDLFPVTVMPPLLPSVMAALSRLIGPEYASRSLAVLSIIAIMCASLFTTRSAVDLPVACSISFIVGMSATVVEPAAWGGYPQNFAVAFMLVAAYFASAAMDAPTLKRLMGYGFFSYLVAMSHHAYFGVNLAVVGGVVGLFLVSRPGRRAATRRLLGIVVASIPGAVVFSLVGVSLLRAHYDPAVDASGSSLGAALRYAFPTVRWLWWLLGAAGVFGLLATWKLAPLRREWRVAVSLVLVSVIAFPLTGEARLLPPLVLGLGIGIAIAVGSAGRDGDRLMWSSLGTAVLAGVLAVAWPSTDQKAQIAFDYYHVLTPSLVRTAAFLDEYPEKGEAAIRTDIRGWPVGWWFRGLSNRPVLVGSDSQWLGFPRERVQAQAVDSIFSETSSPDAVRQIALSAGVRFLVYRPRDWPGWNGWSFDAGSPLVKIYDDGTYEVLAVREPD